MIDPALFEFIPAELKVGARVQCAQKGQRPFLGVVELIWLGLAETVTVVADNGEKVHLYPELGDVVDEVMVAPLSKLRVIADPTLNWPWSSPPGRVEDIENCDPVSTPVSDDSHSPDLHLGRIRWLIENGWTDAVVIDLGVPALGYDGPDWPVLDGNHRIFAAIVRGDETIDVSAQGDVEHCRSVLT